MNAFKRVALLGRIHNPGVTETVNTLFQLLSDQGIDTLVETETATVLEHGTPALFDKADIPKTCDLAIIVGGDGSLLSTAQVVVDKGIPVLGINRGSLGFLTEVHPAELKTKVNEVLAGQYTIEERFLLASNINNCKLIALNEFALVAKEVPHLIEFEIFVDDKFVCSQRSDGLIVATPTGSTAYALSAGGPILHPELNAIEIVPMFPHTLSMRPIVINGYSEVKIVLAEQNTIETIISCDGQCHLPVSKNNEIIIKKHAKPLKLIHPLGHDYYEALRTKLHWGTQLA